MSRVLPVPGAAPVPHRAGPVHEVGSLRLSEHRFRVPLAHARAWTHPEDPAVPEAVADREIEVFARVASSTDPEAPVPVQRRPYLVYLQGGPGMASPRPASDSGWLVLLAPHYRVVLLDQRGTGLSTPIDRPDAGGGPAATARLLAYPDLQPDLQPQRST